jgi:PAS domain S-box-containing protein
MWARVCLALRTIAAKAKRLRGGNHQFAASHRDARSDLHGSDAVSTSGQAFDSVARRAQSTHTEMPQQESALRHNQTMLASVLNCVPQSIFWKDCNGMYLGCNEVFAREIGLDCPEQVVGKTDFDLPWPRGEAEQYRADDREVMETGRAKRHIVEPLQQADGTRLWIDTTKVPLLDADGRAYGVLGVHEDFTDRKRMAEETKAEELRLQSLLRISQHRTTTLQELLDFALDEIIRFSGSRYGYIFHYDETTEEFSLHAWSKEVMKECVIANPPSLYRLSETGIWGEAVRQRKPIILNEFGAPNPLKKGYPQGHAPLLRFMTVPVFSEDRIVAVAGVANRDSDYTESDARDLRLMMDVVWKTVGRKRAEQALQDANAALEQRVQERTALANERAAQLQMLAAQLTTAEHRERRRVATILHDHFQQLLASAKFTISRLRRHLQDENLLPLVQSIEDVIDESIRTSRSLTVELCPPILYDMGLAQALLWLGRWMQDKHGLHVEVTADPQANPPDEDISVLLFHSVRELLFNVVKHAKVDRAIVRMTCGQNGRAEILVADEGAGFDPGTRPASGDINGGFGLFSLRERLEMAQGRLVIDSTVGAGTRITLLGPAPRQRMIIASP